MSFITEIFDSIANESERKGTFFSVVNYLVANDDVLNSEAKNYLKPILQSVLSQSYGSKYGQFAIDHQVNDSEVSMLLNCRSELYQAL